MTVLERRISRSVEKRAPESDHLDFVLSDGSVDHYGDVVDPRGWDLSTFKNNPIALFNHNKDFVIGRWTKVSVVGDQLRGSLELATEGISARLDEIIKLAKAGFIKAVSVGFRPIEFKHRDEGKGRHFLKQVLVETSLVSIPANPNAISVARSLVSDETVSFVFGEHADEGKDEKVNRHPGEQAEPSKSYPHRSKNMSPISQQIQVKETRIVELQDVLTKHLENLDNQNISDDQLSVTKQFNEDIKSERDRLEVLKASENALATKAVATEPTRVPAQPRRPFELPSKAVKPIDYVFRAVTIQTLAHVRKSSISEARTMSYGDDEVTKGVTDFLVSKAASVPATTTTTGWAAELVQTANYELIESLLPMSVYPGLASAGGKFTFGRNGIISLPSRSPTPTIAGSFVAQGAAIPVRQGAFTAVTLTPKKMAVISTFTREIAEHSTPSIEAMIRQMIQEDTAMAIDSVLLDAVVASTVRPAGLRAGVTVTAATAGGGFTALTTDIKNLIGALVTASNGQLRNPVWIMNPAQALSIALTQNAGGDFPLASDMQNGRLMTYPVLQSTAVPAGMIIIVDASDFFSATGDEPNFSVSDQATLHMEDTAPQQLSTVGTTNTVAAPVRSLWQTDSIAIRMILDINWALRRTGTVAWTTAVTW